MNLPLYRVREAPAFCCSVFAQLNNGSTSTGIKCSQNAQSVPVCRRTVLRALALFSLAPSVANADLKYPELRGLNAELKSPIFVSRNGVKLQEIAFGSGEETVEPGNTVSVKYVLRRSNGYFIDASYGFDRFDTFSFKAGTGDVIEGFDRGIQGMKVDGRRRFIVPPELGYVNGVKGAGPIPPDFGAKRSIISHAKEPLIFEVLIVKIRK